MRKYTRTWTNNVNPNFSHIVCIVVMFNLGVKDMVDHILNMWGFQFCTIEMEAFGLLPVFPMSIAVSTLLNLNDSSTPVVTVPLSISLRQDDLQRVYYSMTYDFSMSGNFTSAGQLSFFQMPYIQVPWRHEKFLKSIFQ